MLVGLVAYALKTSESISLVHFQPRIQTLLSQMKSVDDFDELPWYSELYSAWQEQVDEDSFSELLDEFRETIDRAHPEQLMGSCIVIRIQLLVDNAKPINYEISNCYATFTVQWKDGNQVEYTARPFNLRGGQLDVSVISRLSHLFADQFVEATVQPGLDTFHDQVAKPFDQEKLQELAKVLETHINSMDAAERTPYSEILVRIQHQFGPGPGVKLKQQDAQPLERTEGGGGFQ